MSVSPKLNEKNARAIDSLSEIDFTSSDGNNSTQLTFQTDESFLSTSSFPRWVVFVFFLFQINLLSFGWCPTLKLLL